MDELLTPEDFRDLAAPLRVELAAQPSPLIVELTVDSVEELPPHRLRARPFSLVLRGPREPVLAQATYALRHPRLGPVDVFLVPVAQTAQATSYEATFN